MVLALWSQQWPRLRRSFRFCTFAASDRSFEKDRFDLQVLPSSDRSIRTRFSAVVDADTSGLRNGRWLDDAVHDLLHPNGLGLRDFFRRFGADVPVGREVFRPLCRLHRVFAAPHTPVAVHDAIAVLQEDVGAMYARTAKATVAKAALEQVETLDEHSFRFLWDNVDLVDAGTLISNSGRLGRAAWRRDPRILVHGMDDCGTLRTVLERTLREVDAGELVAGLVQAPALRGAALACRPELVGQPAFWAKLDSIDEAFETANDGHMKAAALAAMLAGRSDLALRAVQEFGSMLILQVLGTSWASLGDGVDDWLNASVVDSGAVAEFLATEPAIPGPMLYGLARKLPPDAVPNEYGEDPWLISDRHKASATDDSAASYMAAYLLSRALGRGSRCPGQLAQLSFERTHAAVASNRLLDEGWRLLESRLPWSVTWFEWDRCHRLRAGVTDLFIERGLAPSIFAKVCENNHLFSLLSDRASRNKRGRNYLKQVRRCIEGQRDPTSAARATILKKLLR